MSLIDLTTFSIFSTYDPNESKTNFAIWVVEFFDITNEDISDSIGNKCFWDNSSICKFLKDKFKIKNHDYY